MARSPILGPVFVLAGGVLAACGGSNDGEPAGAVGGSSSSTGGTTSGGGTASGGDGVGGAASGGQPSGTGGTLTGGPLPPELTWTNQLSLTIVEGIWGSGPNDIYAIGRNGNLWHSTGDGTWTPQSTPTGAHLTGIWGSGPNNIYVSVNSNVILRSSGDGEWQNDDVFDAGVTLSSVWGLDAEHVYATGNGVRRRLPMGGWEAPQPVSNARGIWGSSPTDLYVITAGVSNLIYHSTGDGSWQPQNAPQASGADSIWGASAEQIYVATGNSILSSVGDGTWVAQLAVGAGQAVWGAGPDAVYACSGEGLFYRSNGEGAWSDGQEIDQTATALSCFSIWGTGADDIYLGTNRGIYHGVSAE